MIKPRIFISPISKNIVDSVIETAESTNPLGLIPSRRQIEYLGGYSNNWKTSIWANYVKSQTNHVLLVRDHGGPEQGHISDPGFDSLYNDCKCMDIIHIDPWKTVSSVDEGIYKTIQYLKFCHNQNPEIHFEIGTEEAIFKYSAKDLEKILYEIKKAVPNIFDKILFAVVQSGTAITGTKNTGKYSPKRLSEMVEVCQKFDVSSKEHNGDYLSLDLISSRFSLGLDSINIGPEFGVTETKILLNLIQDDKALIKMFYDLCYQSQKWKKWMPPGYIPKRRSGRGSMPIEEMCDLILVSGHYVFSEPLFKSLFRKIENNNPNVQNKIKQMLKNKLKTLVKL